MRLPSCEAWLGPAAIREGTRKAKTSKWNIFQKAEKRTKKRKTHLNEPEIEFNALPVAATPPPPPPPDQDRLSGPKPKEAVAQTQKKKNGKTKKTRKIKNEKEKKQQSSACRASRENVFPKVNVSVDRDGNGDVSHRFRIWDYTLNAFGLTWPRRWRRRPRRRRQWPNPSISAAPKGELIRMQSIQSPLPKANYKGIYVGLKIKGEVQGISINVDSFQIIISV